MSIGAVSGTSHYAAAVPQSQALQAAPSVAETEAGKARAVRKSPPPPVDSNRGRNLNISV